MEPHLDSEQPHRCHVVVVVGGDAPGPVDLGQIDLGEVDLVIGADSGADIALALGLTPDVVIGDLDSIDPEGLTRLTRAGATIERHPSDKDSSDLELAFARALEHGATRVTVIGGGGGRLSHLLANATVIAADRRPVRVTWLAPLAQVEVLHGGQTVSIDGESGDLVTLLPLLGDAGGVTTTGLEWRLDDDSLQAGSARGLSNELTGTTATVTLGSGTLLVIHERQAT